MATQTEARKEYLRQYRLKNKEKINAYHKNRRKSMGPRIDTNAYTRLKERSLTDELLGLRLIMTKAKTRANKYNREFNLDLDYMVEMWKTQKGLCNLTKRPMSLVIDSGHNKASLDRIDSSNGYTKENCQLVISAINQLKLDLPQSEFIALCKDVVKYN